MVAGETWEAAFLWQADNVTVNLTGYTAKFQIRRHGDHSPATPGTPLYSTTETGGVALSNSDPNIVLSAAAATTESWPPGEYVHELELTSPGGVVTKFLRGPFVVLAEIAR